jgi:hypothetical protein
MATVLQRSETGPRGKQTVGCISPQADASVTPLIDKSFFALGIVLRPTLEKPFFAAF